MLLAGAGAVVSVQLNSDREGTAVRAMVMWLLALPLPKTETERERSKINNSIGTQDRPQTRKSEACAWHGIAMSCGESNSSPAMYSSAMAPATRAQLLLATQVGLKSSTNGLM